MWYQITRWVAANVRAKQTYNESEKACFLKKVGNKKCVVKLSAAILDDYTIANKHSVCTIRSNMFEHQAEFQQQKLILGKNVSAPC